MNTFWVFDAQTNLGRSGNSGLEEGESQSSQVNTNAQRRYIKGKGEWKVHSASLGPCCPQRRGSRLCDDAHPAMAG